MRCFFVVILVSVFAVTSSFGQSEYSAIPPFQRDSTVPNFSILQPDSSWFNKSDLTLGRPLVIVYFNPDCGHCQHTAEAFAKKMKDFSNVTFVWATYLAPLDSLTKFSKEYGLNTFPNVHFGKDLKYFIPSFFRVEYTPFMALYDDKGKLAGSWPTGVSPSELSIIIKNMKK